MPGQKFQDTVYDLAFEHDGFFTVVEAKKAGIPSQRIGQMARRGILERTHRGLYRLFNFPVLEERAQLWEAILWPQQRIADAQGVLSHETALALWGLSDVNPAHVHITVPRKERIRREPPSFVELHFEDLAPDEITSHEGLPITTVLRTIGDSLKRGESRHAYDALADAERRHLISRAEARALRRGG